MRIYEYEDHDGDRLKIVQHEDDTGFVVVSARSAAGRSGAQVLLTACEARKIAQVLLDGAAPVALVSPPVAIDSSTVGA